MDHLITFIHISTKSSAIFDKIHVGSPTDLSVFRVYGIQNKATTFKMKDSAHHYNRLNTKKKPFYRENPK